MIESTREKALLEASKRKSNQIKVDSKIKLMNFENQTLDFDNESDISQNQYITSGRVTTGTIVVDPLREVTDENLTTYITKSFTGLFNKSGSKASLKTNEKNKISKLFKW